MVGKIKPEVKNCIRIPPNPGKNRPESLLQTNYTSVTYSLSVSRGVGLLGGFPRCFANGKTSVALSCT